MSCGIVDPPRSRWPIRFGSHGPPSTAFGGSAGVLRFDRPVADVLGTVMGEGLGHHYGIGYGDVRVELWALGHQLDLSIIVL